MFRKLRGALRRRDITGSYLGEVLGLSAIAISRRMTGKVQWRLDEMYAILKLIDEEPERLHEYFPAAGMTCDNKNRKEVKLCH